MDQTLMTLVVAAIVGLLFLSALFSLGETAFTAASYPHLHHLAAQGDKRAKSLLALSAHKERVIGSILLVNTLINILASSLSTALFLHFYKAGVFYATLVMTPLIFVFSEMIPKTLALASPERLVMIMAPLLRVITSLFLWCIVPLQFFSKGLSRRISSSRDASHALRGSIDLYRSTNSALLERKMLHSVLDLGDIEVQDIMVHRGGVFSIDAGDPTRVSIDTVLSSPYSRIPLTKEGEIVGVLHAKSLLPLLRQGQKDDVPLETLATPPWFVPATTNLLDQLQHFQKRREHCAIVVDEYGSFMGIVTLEDILEEIVGSIEDEHDSVTTGIRRQKDGSYIVQGTVTLREINKELGWNLLHNHASTIAGLLLHESRRIPEQGEAFHLFGCVFEVLRKRDHRLSLIRVQKKPEA